VHGNNVPGCYASLEEVVELAKGAARGGYAVYESAGGPGGKMAESLETIAKVMPVTFTLTEAGMARSVAWLEKANADEDTTLIGQVSEVIVPQTKISALRCTALTCYGFGGGFVPPSYRYLLARRACSLDSRA
jgi:hypothetical protein